MMLEKVKSKDGEITIAWSVPNGTDREHCTLESTDEPEAPFRDAFRALRSDVLAILEIEEAEPEDENADPLSEVTTVSISRDTHGTRGFVFSVRRKVAAGTYSVSTPRMRAFDEESEGSGVNMLTESVMERVEDLCHEAIRYIQGHRSQGELDLDGKGEAAEGEDGEAAEGDPFGSDAAAEGEPALASV